jgi:26S proteasome regulatory subunit N5
VEVERARLTRLLSKMKEEEGNISEAADILQELQVETYGSMEKREKTDFLLEQMRLCLARKDFTRTLIISRKVSKKYLSSDPDAHDLKLRFYELMIEHAIKEGLYLEACKCYKHIFNTPVVAADAKKWQEVPLLTKVKVHF